MVQTSGADRPVRLINFLAFGGNDVLGAGSMAVISSWSLIFYTQFCGLSATQAGLILAAPRLLDAIASPLIGHISDHFGNTWLGRKFGRRRFFILAAIPLMPLFALMWLPGQGFWYYLATLALFELVYAMEIIPFETLAAEMSRDFRTKAKFAGFRILIAQASAILAGFLPAMLINYLGRDSADTFFYMGCIFAVLFMITAGLLYLFSWERPGAAAAFVARQEKTSVAGVFAKLFRNLFSTLRIRAFRLHLGMYLGGYISQDIFNSAFTFFVVFALAGTTAMAAGLVGTMYFVQFVAVMLAIYLSLRASPAMAYRMAAVSFAIGALLLLGFWQAGMRAGDAIIWIAIGFAGLGRGALNYIPWATYNYMADVDEVVTGLRREGSFAGVMTFIRKTAQSLTLALTGIIIEWGGFVSGAKVQSPQALNTIAAILGVGTLAMLAFGIVVSLKFRLTHRTHEILMAEIERFRSGERTPSSEEGKAIAEDLSGWSYDRLWGNNPVGKARRDADAPARPSPAGGVEGGG